MRFIIAALLILGTSSAFAGKMKDISIGNVDSIVAVLELPEAVLSIENQRFVTARDSDLPSNEVVVISQVRNKYSGAIYQCEVSFAQVKNSYIPVSALCN